MFKFLSQALIAAAMLIALLGQSVAYAHIACEMPMDSSHSMSHEGMNHGHGDTDHQTMMDDMDDCCAADCSCPGSSCTSVSLLISKQSTVEFDSTANALFSDSLGQPKALTSPLFRPPILA